MRSAILSRVSLVLASVAALGVSVGAVGCATLDSGDHVNPEGPTWISRPNGALAVSFRRALTATTRKEGEEYERGRAEIDVKHGRVFVGSSDHGLYALRATDGSTLFRFETLNAVQSEPLYDPETESVFFGSHDGALYAISAEDGHLRFRYDAAAEVSKRPAIAGETLFFANAADFLFAVDRRTGKERWKVHRTPALGMEVSGHAGPAVSGDTVYMAFSDGHVGAFNVKDGAERWPPVDLSADAEQAAGGETVRYLDVDTTPVLDETPSGKLLYVASYSGGVVALDAQTGSRVWSNEKALGVTDLLLFVEPAHGERKEVGSQKAGFPKRPERKVLIASSATTGLWGIDAATGRALFRNKVPEGGVTAPAIVGGALAVGTSRYGLFLISPLDGKVIDGIETGSGFSQVPVAYGRHVYALSNGGNFFSLDIDAPVRR
jgi:outer membrane protein assembly factor BamB